MQKVFRINENGFFVEDVIIQEGQEIPEGCIDVEVPEGFYLPRWNGAQWEEGLTQAEIDAIRNTPKPPTQEERLAAMESVLLSLMGL